MTGVTCDIEFDNNPIKVVSAGQSIRGTVRLNLPEIKIVHGIYIQIYGSAFVHWTEGSGENQNEYTGSEEYLNELSYFVGGGPGLGTVRLNPGVYHYTFQCTLPPELPTSVEGYYGHIRYIVRVVLDFRPHHDTKFEQPFTLIKMINLNDDPALRKPIIVKEYKTFFPCYVMFCSPSYPMIIIARTPVGGYTPGQIINLEIKVNNQSEQPLTEISVQLIKHISYFTNSKNARKRIEKVPIIERDAHGCDANQEEVVRVNIEIPPIPPTDDFSSNIIKVKYMIRIIGSLNGCHRNPLLELPITIGSYPIEDAYPFAIVVRALPDFSASSSGAITQQPMLTQFPDPNDDTISQQTLVPSEEEQPPTYEEAMRHAPSDDFMPKYPMFKRRTSYSNGN